MTKRQKGPEELWSVLAVAFYKDYLSDLTKEKFVPVDLLWCLRRTSEDKKTPEKIKVKIEELLKLFNPRSGHRRPANQKGTHKKRPGRRMFRGRSR